MASDRRRLLRGNVCIPPEHREKCTHLWIRRLLLARRFPLALCGRHVPESEMHQPEVQPAGNEARIRFYDDLELRPGLLELLELHECFGEPVANVVELRTDPERVPVLLRGLDRTACSKIQIAKIGMRVRKPRGHRRGVTPCQLRLEFTRFRECFLRFIEPSEL